jgi:hypothetical protein
MSGKGSPKRIDELKESAHKNKESDFYNGG